MLKDIAQFLEENALSCVFKKYLGIDCLGCGSQRSFILLLRGNLTESFLMYPALIPLIITILFTTLHIIFDIRHGQRIILISFIITVLMMIINFIFKHIIL